MGSMILSSSETWCHVSPSSGSGNGKLTVTFDENTTGEDRTAVITVKSTVAGVPSKTITVVQRKQGTVVKRLTARPSSLTFESDSSGQTQTITVQSNVTWTAVSTATNVCTVSPSSGTGDGTITVTSKGNTSTTEDITSAIHISADGVSSVNINVTVKKKYVEPESVVVSPSALSKDYTAGSQVFTVTSNVAWTTVSDSAWCTISDVTSTSFKATWPQNDSDTRTAHITVKGIEKTVTVNVSQAKKDEPQPTGNIVFVLQNNCGKEVRLSGRIILNLSRNPNNWSGSIQTDASIHGPQVGTSWAYNDIIIAPGLSYTATIPSIDNTYTDGTWYFINYDSNEYNHTVFLYSRIWRVSKKETEGSNNMYVITPLQNTALKKGQTYTFSITGFNKEASLAPNTTTDSGTAASYYILEYGKQTWP